MKHARVSTTAPRVHAVLPQPRIQAAGKQSLCGQRPTGSRHAAGYWRRTTEPVDCQVCLTALERLAEIAVDAGLYNEAAGRPSGSGVRRPAIIPAQELTAPRARLEARNRARRRNPDVDTPARNTEAAWMIDELTALLEPPPPKRITAALDKKGLKP